MKIEFLNNWDRIGMVLGNTSTDTYNFSLKGMKGNVGDIVACHCEVPNSDKTGVFDVLIWGRIVSIDRFNPFFPQEAAMEIAENAIPLENTPLSISRDHLNAEVQVMGMTSVEESEELFLKPLSYPVQPAAAVYYPDNSYIKKLLNGSLKDKTPLHIGSLIARSDVQVSLSAQEVVSKHLAILAMTGGGKTVAARQVLSELIKIEYPLIIFDPHGDYIGFYENQEYFKDSKIKLFYPKIRCTESEADNIIHSIIEKLGIDFTPPQKDVLSDLINNVSYDPNSDMIEHFKKMSHKASSDANEDGSKSRGNKSTYRAVARGLRFVTEKLTNMERSNENLRKKFKGYKFEAMPDPFNDPDELINRSQVSIIYLGGYDHITQSSIVSIVMESLFNHRSSYEDRIPRFLAVIEEAHNFIPSGKEGTRDTPSLPTLRKVITEGRKFGTGLMIISQRPGRLDETTLSQCNTFLVLKLVNPNDQRWVKNVMENLSEKDANWLKAFGPGQGLVSGHAVSYPLQVQVKFDENLRSKKLGDEDFIKENKSWDPDKYKDKNENSDIIKSINNSSKRSKKKI